MKVKSICYAAINLHPGVPGGAGLAVTDEIAARDQFPKAQFERTAAAPRQALDFLHRKALIVLEQLHDLGRERRHGRNRFAAGFEPFGKLVLMVLQHPEEKAQPRSPVRLPGLERFLRVAQRVIIIAQAGIHHRLERAIGRVRISGFEHQQDNEQSGQPLISRIKRAELQKYRHEQRDRQKRVYVFGIERRTRPADKFSHKELRLLRRGGVERADYFLPALDDERKTGGLVLPVLFAAADDAVKFFDDVLAQRLALPRLENGFEFLAEIGYVTQQLQRRCVLFKCAPASFELIDLGQELENFRCDFYLLGVQHGSQ